MEQDIRAVERWAELPREKLVAAVAAAVRQPPAHPSRFWRVVHANPVLAAAVRGVLSSLLRDKEGTRDEVFWTYRINTVRAALNSTDDAPNHTPGAPRVAAAPKSRAGAPPSTTTGPITAAALCIAPGVVADLPGAEPSGVPAIEFLAPGV
jgi:hypothetical protein